MTVYDDYQRDRVGWFFGLSGWQFSALAVGSLPVFWSVSREAWSAVGIFAVVWAAVFVLVVVPVKGRSATGWLTASTAFAVGGLRGWTRFRSKASKGAAEDLGRVDLPGVLQGVEIHDGPPHAPTQDRVAVIQDHGTRTWSVTAAVVHPGVGMMDGRERHDQGLALTELLDACARTELIDEVLIMVRTVPDDGAERAEYVRTHASPSAPALSRQINAEMGEWLTRASVRTEEFFTICVPESRLGREAREHGGGVMGRARVLYELMAEVESHLSGGLDMGTVNWLTSPELALACRTGFAPGDRASVIAAVAERETNPDVEADIPWAMAGPSGSDQGMRHYSHDAWNSVSVTVRLPERGAVIGALAPVLTPSEVGERRSLVVAYPLVDQRKADRQTQNSEFASGIGAGLRARAGIHTRARQRNAEAKAEQMDAKLARGNAMIVPYAVATVTVPKTLSAPEAGRRLDASVRRAGFAPMRLDIAHGAAFAASTIPLGSCLSRRGER